MTLKAHSRSRKTRLYVIVRIWWLILLTAVTVSVPSTAFCDMQDFIPRITDYNGELDIFMLRQEDKNTVGGIKISTIDNSIIEQLKVYTSGFIYHPAFITFAASGALGLLEDQFKQNNSSSSPWSSSDANEYNINVHVLPEKPYTLDLLSSRTETFSSANAFSNIKPVIYVNGATFNYRGPISLSTSYTETKTISDTTTDSGVLTAQATHTMQHSFSSIGFTRSDTSTNTGTDYDEDYYFVSNQLQFDRLLFFEQLVLRSDLKYDDYTQNQISQITNGSDNQWTEYLQLKLPWRFESDLTYSRIYSTSTAEPTAPFPSYSQSNTNESFNEVLSNRLGDSLFTSYVFNDTTNKSSGGQSDSESNALNLMYTKKIPWGIFTAGVNGTIMTTDNTGSISTLNEVHQSAANGIDSFTLQPGLIDPATIVVYLIAPGTGIRYQLVNNVNYLIDQIGNTLRITVQSFFLFPVPGFTPNPDINFVYTFNVSYTSAQGTFDLETKTVGYNIGFVLFNNLLNPYYSYQNSGQKLTSGFFVGQLSSYTQNTVGIAVQKAPFRLWTEYQTYNSTINPNNTWKSRLDFHENVFKSLSVGAGVFYNRTDFLQNQSSVGPTSPYTQTVRGATVSIQKIFPWNLNISETGYFAQTTGLTNSNAYSLNGLVTWRFGRLSVDVQTTYELVDSLANSTKSSTGQMIYLVKLRRQLF